MIATACIVIEHGLFSCIYQMAFLCIPIQYVVL